MAYFDVFNGDADGICALLQLRLAQPLDSTLITGVKRDIKLLAKVEASSGDQVTVLDISMDKNKEALLSTLATGAAVFYCDHHFAGDIPQADNLTSLIDTDAGTCTSLLVNQHLNGQFAHWAVVAAYGDNMLVAADALADELGLTAEQKQALKDLGIAINYNGYGADLSDLHIAPADLFKALLEYPNPLEMIAQKAPLYVELIANYQADLKQVESAELKHASDTGSIFVLPNQAWARRISGVWGNDLANAAKDKAHAVLTELAKGGYLVSVRSPKNRPEGADDLCRQFETGGGRKAAAGINVLPEEELNRFINTFEQTFA
ncbi:DHH family phosphoesterase [Catenovulum sp. SM1970]|uniref:DHH family phosphoesterase n=1 Tax=Marinifaba aquimaris TaxID=2741323 RepID=UPI001573893A|nr:DHH family phosphoesterase [Marinifaba aquimaris]NTS78516.1 DHH family phosphoesterase [Marinifaba aquimaris]